MSKGLEFTNPNRLEAGSHYLLGPVGDAVLAPGKTGIHSLDASRAIFQTLVDTENKGNECLAVSLVDSLTGCYNRNFFEKFKKENFDPSRDHGKLALVYADLNGLKKINDEYGHEAGDNLIIYMVAFLKHNYRPGDIVIRLGGDEFVVMCHNDRDVSNFDNNLDLEDRKVLSPPPDFNFGTAVFDKENNYKPDYASGIAVYDTLQDDDLGNTLKRADHLMYQHKEAVSTARAMLSKNLVERAMHLIQREYRYYKLAINEQQSAVASAEHYAAISLDGDGVDGVIHKIAKFACGLVRGVHHQ